MATIDHVFGRSENPFVNTPVDVEAPAEQLTRGEAPKSSGRWDIWLPVTIAFLLRFGWVLLGHKYRFRASDHYDFGEEMGAVARSIVTGHGFSSPFPELSGPTTWVAPVYPFLIACVFKVFGLYSTASALVMLALNSAFSALTCWPMYLIARDLTNRRIAIYSTWLWALVPEFMMWAVNWVWDAALTGLVLTTFTLLTIRMARGATRKQWIGFGLAWGLAALLNPTMLSLLPFLMLYIMWHARRRGEPWFGRAALCSLLVVMVVTPWLVRNYRAFGKFVFIRGNFWAELRYGNAIGSQGFELGFTHPEINQLERKKYLTLGEQAYFESKKHDVMRYIRDNPSYFARLCFQRMLFFWWDFGDYYGYTPDVLLTIGRRVFSTLGLVGLLWLFVKRREGAGAVAIVLCIFPAVFYMTYPAWRYRHVIEPLLLICALWALAQVKEFKKIFATE